MDTPDIELRGPPMERRPELVVRGLIMGTEDRSWSTPYRAQISVGFRVQNAAVSTEAVSFAIAPAFRGLDIEKESGIAMMGSFSSRRKAGF